MEKVSITTEDISSLKLIGEGTEAKIYKKDNDTLYKIYTSPINEEHKPIIKPSFIYDYVIDEDNVKVVQKNKKIINTTNANPYPYYLDNNGVKTIYDAHVIYEATLRQPHITKTDLPKGVIYLDGKFNGCILKNHKHTTDLHNMYFLPRKIKLRILLELLEKLKELTDNNIYHLDLASYNPEFKTHSNVLINPFTLKTYIIDIDGKSTVYSKEESNKLLRTSYTNFLKLIAEYVFYLDLNNDLQEEEYDYRLNELMRLSGLNSTDTDRIISYYYDSYEKNKDLLLKLLKNN